MGKKCPGRKGVCCCKRTPEDRCNHFLPTLKLLSDADPSKRVQLIRQAPPCLIRLLSECGLNVLKGNVKLSRHQYATLKPHKRVLLSVSHPSASLKERRAALTKKQGGFLPVVLPIILSALSGFAGQAVAKAVGITSG
jgi:hypothetical protein